MKKIIKSVSIIAGVLFLIYVVGKYTRTLVLYNTTSVANYPTLKPGQQFWASNLVPPKQFDLVCYQSRTPGHENETWVHRICGVGGDIIEIKNGDLFINK